MKNIKQGKVYSGKELGDLITKEPEMPDKVICEDCGHVEIKDDCQRDAVGNWFCFRCFNDQ